MINITFPDKTQRQYDTPVTVQTVANDISRSLAKVAVAAEVDNRLVDLSFVIAQDANLTIITETEPKGLEVIRHSTAHLLAHAAKLLYPNLQVTIGPVIVDGFYYDFAYERAFTPEDLQAIEKKMQELVRLNLPVTRLEISRAEAIDYFQSQSEQYKVEIIQAIPETDQLSFYQQGEFIDLCRGPHVPSTGKLKVFKLMKLAGAYWRGDAKNAMLQRVYGTAWATKEDLSAYLHRLEEAEKRDHRKIGKALDLFHLQEEAPGMVFWHDKGLIIYQELEKFIRKQLREQGYQEIRTPLILDRSLWERSGHWEKFHEEMFCTNAEDHDFAIKPMSCPGAVQVFNQGLKSYRDLPLKLAEFGHCHRNEPSGSLHGLLRVRSFVQDDGHIFCTKEQLHQEVSSFIDLLFETYAILGFTEVGIKLSTRPEQRIGADEIWDTAEQSLSQALNEKNLKWVLKPGEGAFYGPKIEFDLRDSIGRVWQCGTVQLDFSMPERLGAYYIAEDGSRQIPVMIHRAILGTLERFIGILIENYAGILPLWLMPLQVIVMNITDTQASYVEEIVKKLKLQGIRAELDLRNEKIGFKIREHTLQKVPYQLIVGDNELNSKNVSVRLLNGENLGTMDLDAFCLYFAEQKEQVFINKDRG
ncbi:threonine--tRNA ligase [soil metagenome]